MLKQEPRSGQLFFLPLGDETVASSRLRCYKLKAALERRGYSASLAMPGEGGTLFIQKRTDDAALAAAGICKRAGGRVLFDIDDFPGCHEFRKRAGVLMSLSDAVTTATPEQGNLVWSIFGLSPDKKVFCLPNPADYDLAGPVEREHRSTLPLKIVWFGNAENYPQHLVQAVASVPQAEFHAITNASDELRRRNPRCSFHPWAYGSFSDTLKRFDLCVLSHEGSEIANAKSANKMATAVLHGLPAIASRTPDYERLARKAGVDQWLYRDLGGLLSRIELMRDAGVRSAYLRTAQGAVWRECDVEAVADRFLEILGALGR